MVLRLFACAALVFACCAKKPSLTDEQYASVYVRARLIQEQFKNRPDSVSAYLGALYRSWGVTPGDMETFIAGKEKKPGDLEKLQQRVLEELKKLDPRPKPSDKKAPGGKAP